MVLQLQGQVIITSGGLPAEFYLHVGNEASVTGLWAIAVDLPEGSLLYTANTYRDYALEEVFAEARGNPRRKYSLNARLGNASVADVMG